MRRDIYSFGDINSDTLIVGLEPHINHDRRSNRIFCFDLDLDDDRKSGGVLKKVFRECNKNIDDYFWMNFKKINSELGEEAAIKFIDFILRHKFKKYVFLGRRLKEHITYFKIDLLLAGKEIHYLAHPAFFLRQPGLLKYVEKWKEIL